MAQRDQPARGRQPAVEAFQGLLRGRRDEDHPGLGVLQSGGQRVALQPRIDGRGDGPQAEGGEIGDQPFGPELRHQRDPLPGLHADPLPQGEGQANDLAIEPPVRRRLPGHILPVQQSAPAGVLSHRLGMEQVERVRHGLTWCDIAGLDLDEERVQVRQEGEALDHRVHGITSFPHARRPRSHSRR